MQNLNNRTPIVNPDGTPTEYFMRLLQGRGGLLEDTQDQVDRIDGEVTALLARQIIAGDGLDGGGPLSADVTLTADVQEILDQITVTQGYVLYRAAGGWAALPPGTSGHFLKTNGAGANPAWALASGGGSGVIPDIVVNLQYIPITFGVNNITGVGMAGTVSNTSSLSYNATNSFTQTPQMRLGTSTANTFGQARSTSALFQAGAGLKYSGQFGVHTAGANMRVMAGFYASGFNGANDPSNAVDAFFVGKDSGDTNLQIMRNDGAGTCTKIDLGSDFPANTSQTDHYYVELTIAVGGASATYYVKRLNTGHEASGSIATDLPTINIGMFAGQWGCTGSTATACYLSFMGFQIASPPT